MDILGQPPDWDRVQEVLDLFPEFEGDVPDEALFWSQGDLELFFGTQGQLKPLPFSGPPRSATCALLSHLRQVLAEFAVDKAAADYRSFCRHRAERPVLSSLPGAAECAGVQRLQRAPEPLQAPVVLEGLQQWTAHSWDLDFWAQEFGGEEWNCRARAPAFEHDTMEGAECLFHGLYVHEYAEYVRVVESVDPECDKANGLAFPRVALDSWTAFCGEAYGLFDDCWKKLRLPGVCDLSHRWMRMFGDAGFDWMERFAGLFSVTLAAAGCISRLHKENHNAHAWFYQIQGRRLFFLFPPQESKNLYEETGKFIPGPEGYIASASPVDVLYPSVRRHPRFANARAQAAVLAPGEALVVPGGWWRYSVALESSVTLQHRFWGRDNKRHMLREVQEFFTWDELPADRAQLYRDDLDSIHAEILEDQASDEEV